MKSEDRNILIATVVAAMVGIVMGIGICTDMRISDPMKMVDMERQVIDKSAALAGSISLYEHCKENAAEDKAIYEADVAELRAHLEAERITAEGVLKVCESRLDNTVGILERTRSVLEQTDNLFKQCMNLHGANYEVK